MRCKGSFTIEAALIMPVILGIIVLFLYIAMFAHDRCAIEYICQSAALYGADESDPDKAAEYAHDRLNSGLILDWNTQIGAQSDEKCVILTIDGAPPVFPGTYRHTVKAYKHFCPKY